MTDGLYVGMTAATARAQQLEAVADNLANAQTPGFKATTPTFETYMVGDGSSQAPYVVASSTNVDRREGTTVISGNPLDVVPEGDLFLAVSMPGGQRGFTRAGRLSVDASGMLSAAGHPLLGASGGPILVPPGAAPTIRENGEVVVAGSVVDSISLFKLEGELQRVGPSLLLPQGKAVPQGETRLRVGELEMGNGNMLDAAVQLVAVQRHFDNAIQAIQTYRKMDSQAVELGRVRG
ncbi:MAG: flagellar hook basal-body protein [Myxococcota bacterium]